jgi:ABC-type tungstate transport system substrate-binding protein
MKLSLRRSEITGDAACKAAEIPAKRLYDCAHTVGEFGVVLMVGGNLPDVTRTAPFSAIHRKAKRRGDPRPD